MAPTAHPQSFTDNGDGTITDNVTGLMWQKVDAGEMTWENAVNNAGAVTTGGYSDWRLPTRAELAGLVDDTRHEPAIDTALFPGVQPRWHWTSTPTAWSASAAWCVLFGDGDVCDGLRGLSFGLALAVRRAGQ